MRTFIVLLGLVLNTVSFSQVINTAGPGTTIKVGKLIMQVNPNGTHSKCVTLKLGNGLCTQ